MFKYVIASLGGFQFGYVVAIMACALNILIQKWDLSLFQQSVIVSAFLIGALPGSSTAGFFCELLGRKKAQQGIACLFFAGALIVTLSSSWPLLFLGRLLQGYAGGLNSVIAPLYIAEISPPQSRGSYVSFSAVAVTVGLLFAYALNFLFGPGLGWKWMFALGAVIAIIHGVGFFFLPESESHSSSKKTTYKQLLKLKYRPMLLRAIFLNVAQQITGINAIFYFAPILFKGITTTSSAFLPAVLIALTNFIASIISMFLVDRWGRKPLLIGSLGIMTISLISLISCYLVGIEGMKWTAILSVLIYVCGFALGIGPIPQLVSPEILPKEIRSEGLSFAVLMNWIMNFLVVSTFIHGTHYLSAAGIFSIYAGFCIASLWISYRYIPETKGIKLDR